MPAIEDYQAQAQEIYTTGRDIAASEDFDHQLNDDVDWKEDLSGACQQDLIDACADYGRFLAQKEACWSAIQSALAAFLDLENVPAHAYDQRVTDGLLAWSDDPAASVRELRSRPPVDDAHLSMDQLQMLVDAKYLLSTAGHYLTPLLECRDGARRAYHEFLGLRSIALDNTGREQ